MALSTRDIEITDELCKFTKSFFESAEKERDALQSQSKKAEEFEKITKATVGLRPLSYVVTKQSEQNQESKYKIFNALFSKDCKFGNVFVHTAIEIFLTFKYQLLQVRYKHGKEINSNLEALRQLGEFAGKKCFEQCVTQKSDKNLHLILLTVPSPLEKKIFEFVSNPKAMQNEKSYYTERLCFTIKDENGKEREVPTTKSDFFTDCVAGFNPQNEEIKKKLVEQKPPCILESESFYADRTKGIRVTPNQLNLFLRPAFQSECETINGNNLEQRKHDLALNLNERLKTYNFSGEDFTSLINKILKKIDLDKKYIKAEDDIDNDSDKTNKNDARVSNEPNGIRFNVYDPPQDFEGRKKDLNKISNNIDAQNCSDTIISNANIISGLGGVGKTAIARKFVHKFKKKNSECNVAFIDASNKESLNKSFKELTLRMNLPKSYEQFDQNSKMDTLYQKICKERCIIVFLNANSWTDEHSEDKKGIQDFLPSSLPSGSQKLSILVTTRNRDHRSWNDQKPILLDVFDNEDAHNFVKQKLEEQEEKKKEDVEDINKLIDLCGSLPLALRLAVASINQKMRNHPESGYKISEFLAEEIINILVGSNPKINPDTCRNEKTLYATWDLSLKDISELEKGDLALQILNTMAFSQQRDKIRFKSLQSLFKNKDEESLGCAISLLTKYCLISKYVIQNEGMCYSIHSMVQMVTKEWMVLNCRYSIELFKLAFIENRHQQDCVELPNWVEMFSWLSSRWKDNDKPFWDLSEKILNAIMNKQTLNNENMRDIVRAYTAEYLEKNVIRGKLIGNTSWFSTTGQEFEIEAKQFKFSPTIMTAAKAYFPIIAVDAPKITLFVSIIKQSPNSKNKIIESKDDDSTILFLCLPSEYNGMYYFMLGEKFEPHLKTKKNFLNFKSNRRLNVKS